MEILQCAEGMTEDHLKSAIKKSRIIYNRGEVNEPSRFGDDLGKGLICFHWTCSVHSPFYFLLVPKGKPAPVPLPRARTKNCHLQAISAQAFDAHFRASISPNSKSECNRQGATGIHSSQGRGGKGGRPGKGCALWYKRHKKRKVSLSLSLSLKLAV
eukprot:1158884-Pelagomonas_calceolata.AAC.2